MTCLRSSKLFLLLLSLCVSGPVFAGEAEVIVTAARSEEKTTEIAGAVSSINSADLQKVSGIHPAETLNRVAGVNIHRGSGQEHLTAIRSPVLTGGAGAGSFLYLEDGVPLRAAGFANVNGLFESVIELAETVEVTKGPGSVLYGSNAVHGLINIRSASPSDTLGTKTDFLFGVDGFARLKASVSLPTDTGGFRVGLVSTHDNGFRNDSGYDQYKLQVRYDHMGTDWDMKGLFSLQSLEQETAGFIRGDDAYRDPGVFLNNLNPEAYRDGKSARVYVRFDKKEDNETGFSFIPYMRWTQLEFLRHFVPGQAVERNGHYSVGLLSSYTGNYDNGGFTIGFDGEFTSGEVNEFQPGPSVFSFVQGPHYDYRVKSTVLSGYGQTDFALTDNLTLDLGVRLDWIHYDYATTLSPGRYGRFLVVNDRSDSFTILTPKASLNYTPNDVTQIYLRAARGQRAPQVSDAYSLQTQQISGEIRSEVLDSLEIGAKTLWQGFDIHADAYVMKKQNFFFRDAAGFNVTDGRTRHYGIEFDIVRPVTDRFGIYAKWTWAWHTYDFSRPNTNPANDIRNGENVDTAPNFLATFGVDMSVTGALSIGFDWQIVGEYFTNPGNTESYSGHDIVTLRGHYDLNDNLSVYGRIDNLLNIRYADRADFAFGSERYFPGRPRAAFFGMRVEIN